MLPARCWCRPATGRAASQWPWAVPALWQPGGSGGKAATRAPVLCAWACPAQRATPGLGRSLQLAALTAGAVALGVQGPTAAAERAPSARVDEVGYITDLEGDLATFERYLESEGSVLRRGEDGRLELASETSAFVFGGDLFDRGPGDLRLARALLDLRARHPDRVVLLMGNRDVNKMRLTAELDASYVAKGSPETAFSAWWDPTAPKLARYLDAQGLPDTQMSRLRWMLKHTLGSGGAFEYRRQELLELKLQRTSGGAGSAATAMSITDEDVTESFMASVEREDGEVAAYLANAQIAAVFGDTLFVHGAAEERALGFVPSLATEYGPHTAEEIRSLPGRQEGLPLHEWVEAINAFGAAAVSQWRAEPRWRQPPEPAGGGPLATTGRRGGEALMAYQCRPAIAAMTVVVTCYVDGLNMPGHKAIHGDLKEGLPKCSDPLSPAAMRYLQQGGVRRVVVGHKPSGAAPAVLRTLADDGLGYEVISADTNYASRSTPDLRGGSWCEVRVRLRSAACSQSRLRGVLADGAGTYDFDLPPLGEGAKDGPSLGDPFVGCQTKDGWWVRVRLGGAAQEARYLLSRGEGRKAESRVVPAAKVDLRQSRL